MPDEVSSVQFPVWSKADQSDLRWITAQKKSNGAWEADVNVTDYSAGTVYQVHAYATLTNGEQVLVGNSSFKVKGLSAELEIQNYNSENGTFDAVVKNIVAPTGIQEIKIPVWSTGNQSDIVWYTAHKQSNGTYKAAVDIANHDGNTGVYNVHAYILDNNGKLILVGTTTQKVEQSDKIKITVEDKEGKEARYELTAKMAGKSDKVDFAVWSDANGQDDLIWYSGKKKSSTWCAEAVIDKHKASGVYNVHVYSTKREKTAAIGNTTFKVSAPTGKLEIEEAEGSLEVILKNVTSKSGIDEVQIPVWSKPDQSDLRMA